MTGDSSTHLPVETFPYRQAEYDAWVAAHASWWPACAEASVWGAFEPQARGGRCVFSQRNQRTRHFAETLVVWHYERLGYVCWTTLRVFHRVGRHFSGIRNRHTKMVAALMRESLGVIPQTAREEQSGSGELHLKNIDVVGYHFGSDHWVFTEVKKDSDTLKPAQIAALEFLRRILPEDRAAVFVAKVKRTKDG